MTDEILSNGVVFVPQVSVLFSYRYEAELSIFSKGESPDV
jgi:hypothetical protein